MWQTSGTRSCLLLKSKLIRRHFHNSLLFTYFSMIREIWCWCCARAVKIHHNKKRMINFGYTLGFMDYGAFVVIVAIYFIHMIYLNKRVNRNVNKNQLECGSEWNLQEMNESCLSGWLCLLNFLLIFHAYISHNERVKINKITIFHVLL